MVEGQDFLKGRVQTLICPRGGMGTRAAVSWNCVKKAKEQESHLCQRSCSGIQF